MDLIYFSPEKCRVMGSIDLYKGLKQISLWLQGKAGKIILKIVIQFLLEQKIVTIIRIPVF